MIPVVLIILSGITFGIIVFSGLNVLLVPAIIAGAIGVLTLFYENNYYGACSQCGKIRISKSPFCGQSCEIEFNELLR